MSVNEVLQSLGSWELHLKPSTPDDVIAQLDYFGHVAIVDGPVDVSAAGNALLAGARYVGVCREKGHPDDYVRGGNSLVFWLGDEDGKGPVILTEISLTNATLAQVVTALKPATVTTGTVYAQTDPAVRYTGKHVFQTRREALAIALAPFGAEIRVNPDFSIDVGAPSQLYATAVPDTIIKRRAVGADPGLTAIGGDFDTSGSAADYSSDVTLLGQTVGTADTPGTVFATGAAAAPSVPWKDPQGNQLKITRLISESGETTGSVAARAQLQLNRFNRTTSEVKVTAADFEIQGTFVVGDATYVYDPDSGIVNPALEVFFRGEKLNPDIVRVTGRTWPIVKGMTVAWRTDAGVWLDLTPWVVWENTGQHELTVGDLPKTLLKSGAPNGPVQDRVDAARGNAPDATRIPKAPTGLVLSTTSSPNAKGRDAAVITAAWDPVTQYTDSTSVALSHYELQYRPQYRSPSWTASFVTDALTADLPVTAALGYDAQVRAVSTGGVASAWSSTASIISAADSTGPATPSDPVVTSYLGLLRIYWNGLSSTAGPMPTDFNRVDVHVGTSSAFTASAATLVSSLSAPGYAHTQAPYGSARFVRFIAYDHNGNPSSPSATVSGTAVQAAAGDIASVNIGSLVSGTGTFDMVMAGRIATALTGARREMNAVGFQAFDASNNLMINLDGANNLLTGIFQTALPGARRIVIGAAGAAGEIDFYAPDGTLAYLHAYTESAGVEAMQMGIPKPGGDGLWNKIHFNSDEWMNLHANKVDLNFLTGGFFIVRRLSARSGGTALTRITADANGVTMFGGSTNATRVQVDATQAYIMGVTQIFLDPCGDSIGKGIMSIQPGGTGGDAKSPQLRMQTSVMGGGVYLGGLIYNIDSGGVNGGVAAVTADNTAYIPFKASAFNVGSDRAFKQDIADAGRGHLAELESMRLRRYRRKPTAHRHLVKERSDGTWSDAVPDPDDVPAPMPEEIGLVAQELEAAGLGRFVKEDEIGKTVELYQLVVATIGAVQELSAIVKGKKAA